MKNVIFKKWAIVGLFLSSLPAMASERALISYRYNNGSLPPPYQERYQCEIRGDTVVETKRQGLNSEISTTKNVVWTADIPDLQSLEVYIRNSENGMISRFPGPLPIGGPRHTYFAQSQSEGKEILLLEQRIMRGQLRTMQENLSLDTPKLIELLAANCSVRK